jgi:hypothetical protein
MLVSPVGWRASASLLAVRVWPSPEYTRITLEGSSQAAPQPHAGRGPAAPGGRPRGRAARQRAAVPALQGARLRPLHPPDPRRAEPTGRGARGDRAQGRDQSAGVHARPGGQLRPPPRARPAPDRGPRPADGADHEGFADGRRDGRRRRQHHRGGARGAARAGAPRHSATSRNQTSIACTPWCSTPAMAARTRARSVVAAATRRTSRCRSRTASSARSTPSPACARC